MKPTDLDSIKAAWKNESSFEAKKLSEADIQSFIGRKSRDISQLFRKGLIFDMVLKGLVGISLAGILVLFRSNLTVVLMTSSIILVSILAIIYQGRMIGKIPESRGAVPVIRTVLENRINFYHHHYIRSLYVGALSNAFLILSGMLYYFYFKYGEIRPFSWDDYLVFTITILIGFALGAYVQIAQHNFQVKQLENCLDEIDEHTITTLTLRHQRNKRRRMILLFSLAIVCGLLLLAFLILR